MYRLKGATVTMASEKTSPDHPDTVLILAAHGSSRRPDANVIINAHAATIESEKLFSNVYTVFLMGGDDFGIVAKNITARHIIIVPIMMSDGYLVDVVTQKINAELKSLDRVVNIRVSDPVGTHDGIAGIVAELAENTLIRHNHLPKLSSVLLVAHGAKERPESKSGAMQHLMRVRNGQSFADVHLALLEEEPFLEDVVNNIPGPCAVVGLFAAPGGHAINDVQKVLANCKRSDLYDAGPIGMDKRVTQIAIDRALSQIS